MGINELGVTGRGRCHRGRGAHIDTWFPYWDEGRYGWWQVVAIVGWMSTIDKSKVSENKPERKNASCCVRKGRKATRLKSGDGSKIECGDL